MNINGRCCAKVFLLAVVVMSSQAIASQEIDNSTSISIHQAANLMQLPLSCAATEYPNKLSQTLHSDDDWASHKALHTAFYGCFDSFSFTHLTPQTQSYGYVLVSGVAGKKTVVTKYIQGQYTNN